MKIAPSPNLEKVLCPNTCLYSNLTKLMRSLAINSCVGSGLPDEKKHKCAWRRLGLGPLLYILLTYIRELLTQHCKHLACIILHQSTIVIWSPTELIRSCDWSTFCIISFSVLVLIFQWEITQWHNCFAGKSALRYHFIGNNQCNLLNVCAFMELAVVITRSHSTSLHLMQTADSVVGPEFSRNRSLVPEALSSTSKHIMAHNTGWNSPPRGSPWRWHCFGYSPCLIPPGRLLFGNTLTKTSN